MEWLGPVNATTPQRLGHLGAGSIFTLTGPSLSPDSPIVERASSIVIMRRGDPRMDAANLVNPVEMTRISLQSYRAGGGFPAARPHATAAAASSTAGIP